MFTFVYDWTYDWINIETFCVLLFGIWFSYGTLAWWLSGKPWNWFVKFSLLTLAVLPVTAVGAFDLLQTLWFYGATIIYGRGLGSYVSKRLANRKQRAQTASDTSPSPPSVSGFKTQWSIKNLLLLVTALAVLVTLIIKNKEDLGLFPTAHAIGFGIVAGCVLLLSTAIGKRATFIWSILAFPIAAYGQFFAFPLIFQKSVSLADIYNGTSFIWGDIEDFATGALLTIAFCFLLVGFCLRWVDDDRQVIRNLGRAAQVVIGGLVLLSCILFGDLMRKASVTYPVRLNRFQTQSKLVLEQAALVEKSELDFCGNFPPDETDQMLAAVENQLQKVEEVYKNIDQVDSKVTFVQQPLHDSWDFLKPFHSIRSLARAFDFRAKWHASHGDYDAAINDAMQTAKLRMAVVDERTLVTRLLAISIQEIGAYGAAPNIGKASDVTLSNALTELLKLDSTEVDVEVDYQNDWALKLHLHSWLGRLDALCGETGYREHFQSIKRAVKRHQATRRQLIVMMALELYKRKHGELPGQLKTLTPEFIPAVPMDPFNDSGAEGVLKYRREGDSYLLYSLGFNGKDDGGCNHEFGYGSPNDETDLNFPEAVRQWVIDEQNEREAALNNLKEQ